MCVPVLRYRPTDLYKLKSSGHALPPHTIIRLKQLGIFHFRGCRGGRRTSRNITTRRTVSNKRRKHTPVQPRLHNLVEVPRLWYSLPSLLLSNVTSLCNKVEEVSVTMRAVDAGIVAITEAWQIVPEICAVDNYQLFHHLRKQRRGGGVAVYCRNDLNPSHLDVNVPEGIEALWLRVSPTSHPRQLASIIVCTVYHPPRSPTAEMLVTHLINTADFLRSKFPCSKLVICGDFNELDVSPISQHLNLTQVVDFPTHGNSTLDLILTDVGTHYLPPQQLPPMGRSTHVTILLPATPTNSPSPAVTRTYRPTPDSAIRNFGQWITHHPWTEVLTVQDVQQKWDYYQDTITTAYHHFFPTKTVRTHPNDVPWITPRIKRLIRQRNSAFHTDYTRYKSLRNQIIREIKAAKKTFYPRKVHNLKEVNIAQWFRTLKDISGLNSHPSSLPFTSHLSNQEAAESINNHFSTICQTLPTLDLTTLPAYLPSQLSPPTIYPFEIANIIKKIKYNRSTTPLDIPIKIYKEFAIELAIPLCSIINASLTQCKCPTQWKTAYVTPIPKVTNPQTPSDLRPIAITPLPSLICEDFVFNLAFDHLKKSIDTRQFGNMKATSTSHYLVSFLNFLHIHLDQRKTSLAVAFVDFRKAFDLVDHSTVINKAIKLGLPPYLVSWLTDFLIQRTQVVRFKGEVSKPQFLSCGVPQGTKIGPLTFLILINDALSDTPNRWKYVDDCTVGIPVDNITPDYTPLQDILDRLHTWTTVNNVTINHNKTVVMHFNTATTPVTPPSVKVGDNPLQLVHFTKLLGITLDEKLDWKEQVNNMVRSASYRLYILRRLRSLGTPTPDLTIIYKSFVLPKLMYASPAWSSSLNSTQKHQLERVQKRACRIILGHNYTHYSQALTALNMSSLSLLHQQALLNFGHGLLHHPRHRELLPPAIPRPLRSLRHYNILKPIKARTNRYKNSSIPTITNLLNNL